MNEINFYTKCIALGELKSKGILTKEEYSACIKAIEKIEEIKENEKSTCNVKEPCEFFSSLGLSVSLRSVGWAKKLNDTLELQFLIENRGGSDIEDICLKDLAINDFVVGDGIFELVSHLPIGKKAIEKNFILNVSMYDISKLEDIISIEFKVGFIIDDFSRISLKTFFIFYDEDEKSFSIL